MTSQTKALNLLVVENTRTVTMRPAEGVTADVVIELLNKRQVKLDGKFLYHSSTGQLLAQLLFSVNTKDYKVAASQSPLPALDTIDLYGYSFNSI